MDAIWEFTWSHHYSFIEACIANPPYRPHEVIWWCGWRDFLGWFEGLRSLSSCPQHLGSSRWIYKLCMCWCWLISYHKGWYAVVKSQCIPVAFMHKVRSIYGRHLHNGKATSCLYWYFRQHYVGKDHLMHLCLPLSLLLHNTLKGHPQIISFVFLTA